MDQTNIQTLATISRSDEEMATRKDYFSQTLFLFPKSKRKKHEKTKGLPPLGSCHLAMGELRGFPRGASALNLSFSSFHSVSLQGFIFKHFLLMWLWCFFGLYGLVVSCFFFFLNAALSIYFYLSIYSFIYLFIYIVVFHDSYRVVRNANITCSKVNIGFDFENSYIIVWYRNFMVQCALTGG